MNEKISYIKLPNITVSELQDVVDFLDDNGIEYVEYYVEDLQNRIDKAIEYIEKFSDPSIGIIKTILKESGE